MGTILVFRDGERTAQCRIALDSGERILVELDADGIAITQVSPPEGTRRLLFRADPETVARISSGLFDTEKSPAASPLQVLVPFLLRLPSAEIVRRALTDAAAEVS